MDKSDKDADDNTAEEEGVREVIDLTESPSPTRSSFDREEPKETTPDELMTSCNQMASSPPMRVNTDIISVTLTSSDFEIAGFLIPAAPFPTFRPADGSGPELLKQTASKHNTSQS